MRIRVIETENQMRYVVSEKNELSQFRMGKDGFLSINYSGSWRLLGFARILPFGRLGPTIAPEKLLGQNMKFKNQKGAFAVVDYDHGTTRIWGDRAVAFFETEVRDR